ncbi:hypothetical protein LQZ19_08475 [Treponema primitia]|uniref:hypothetical protein n=1 Tax=Treponema primitia TaxID=88058 RepID=UPI00397F3018
MPKRTRNPSNPSSSAYVRLDDVLIARIEAARIQGTHAEDSDGTFLGYLIKIGINVYEKQILAAERGELPISGSDLAKIDVEEAKTDDIRKSS